MAEQRGSFGNGAVNGVPLGSNGKPILSLPGWEESGLNRPPVLAPATTTMSFSKIKIFSGTANPVKSNTKLHKMQILQSLGTFTRSGALFGSGFRPY